MPNRNHRGVLKLPKTQPSSKESTLRLALTRKSYEVPNKGQICLRHLYDI